MPSPSNTRQPSPSMEAASELLQFNINYSQENPPQIEPQLAAASLALAPLPPLRFVSNQVASAEKMTTSSALATAAAAAIALRPMMAAGAPRSAAQNYSIDPLSFGLPSSIGAAAAAQPQKREPQAYDVVASDSAGRRLCLNRPIDHGYTDFAPISDDEIRMLDVDDTILTSPGLGPEKKRLMEMLKDMPTKAGGLVMAFPSKLFEVVSNPDLAKIISWMPHGRAFVVKDPDALVRDVLPIYFSQTKFLSFVRQLNLWGFKRLTRGVQGKAYYHELFLRGRPYITLRIKRHKVKGHGFKPMPNPHGEPNFYSFSQLDGSISAEENKLKEVEDTSDKKQDVSSGAPALNHPSELFGFKTANISSQASEKKSDVPTDESDCNFLTSAIPHRSVPPDVAAMTTLDIDQKLPAERQSTDDTLALLRCRQAALSATGAPLGAQSEAIARARLAAINGLTSGESHFVGHPSATDQYTALMQLHGNPSLLSQYAAVSQPSTDDFLTRRLAELQREQNEIEMLRRARMIEELSASHSHLFGGALRSVPRTSQAMTVAEALREANQLEEMAAASRNRARILALTDAIESRSGYEGQTGRPKYD